MLLQRNTNCTLKLYSLLYASYASIRLQKIKLDSRLFPFVFIPLFSEVRGVEMEPQK